MTQRWLPFRGGALPVLVAMLLLVAGCAPVAPATPMPTPTPTQHPLAAQARQEAISYILAHHPDLALSPTMTWQEQRVTAEGLVGREDYRYVSGDWELTVWWLVLPQSEYHVTLLNSATGLKWDGTIDHSGEVKEMAYSSIAPGGGTTEAESREIAENYVRNSPTFKFDGIEDSLRLVATNPLRCPSCWEFVYQFQCAHAGYGDRTGKVLAQVITPHTASIVVQEGRVVSATMDGRWDMIKQSMIENR